jgi:uncharacterized protein YjbI with pentapeptide repeats
MTCCSCLLSRSPSSGSGSQQDQRQQQIENQRAQDAALQACLDQMSTLLLEKDLRGSQQLAVYEAGLINRNSPVVLLSGADMGSSADLSEAKLRNANLSEAHPSVPT